MVFAHFPIPRIPSTGDHLYSGRRRLHDLQWQLEQLLGPWDGQIKVISIDTAVHSMCDINEPVFWHHILSLAKSGYLLGLMMGPPCETWSAVRHEALWNDDGTVASGPRPLRDDNRPWGRGGLLPPRISSAENGHEASSQRPYPGTLHGALWRHLYLGASFCILQTRTGKHLEHWNSSAFGAKPAFPNLQLWPMEVSCGGRETDYVLVWWSATVAKDHAFE